MNKIIEHFNRGPIGGFKFISSFSLGLVTIYFSFEVGFFRILWPTWRQLASILEAKRPPKSIKNDSKTDYILDIIFH